MKNKKIILFAPISLSLLFIIFNLQTQQSPTFSLHITGTSETSQKAKDNEPEEPHDTLSLGFPETEGYHAKDKQKKQKSKKYKESQKQTIKKEDV